jgi:Protein of unknown function (DUF4435)
MVEDYAAYLLAEANSGSAALHQFRILYREATKEVHLFFEGEEDSLFYMPIVRRTVSQTTPYVYVCGGKKNVARARTRIALEGYVMESCLFFVDRDFDDYLDSQISLDDRTYITDNYSIENDIASPSAVAVILSDVVRISPADPEYRQILDTFAVAEYGFAVAMRPFMAWCLAARQCGYEPNLKNVDLKKLIELGSAAIPAKRSGAFATFRRLTSGPEPRRGPDMRSVLCWRRRLGISDRKKWLRGKFELSFFQSALLKLLGEANARRVNAGGKPYKIPASLRDARLFELLGGRVAPPSSLVTFLAECLTGRG